MLTLEVVHRCDELLHVLETGVGFSRVVMPQHVPVPAPVDDLGADFSERRAGVYELTNLVQQALERGDTFAGRSAQLEQSVPAEGVGQARSP